MTTATKERDGKRDGVWVIGLPGPTRAQARGIQALKDREERSELGILGYRARN